jgi:hypothetical protein
MVTTARNRDRRGPAVPIAARGLSLALALAGGPSIDAHADPAIGVDTSGLAFTGRIHGAVADQALAVTNTGTGTLDFTVASDVFWIAPSIDGGSLPPGAATQLTVRISTRGRSLRTHRGSIILRDPYVTSSPVTIPVDLVLTSATSPSVAIAWGDNDYGQSSVPLQASNVVALSASGDTTLALLADGHVLAWGEEDADTAVVPSDVTNAVGIVAAPGYFGAVLADGRYRMWGSLTRQYPEPCDLEWEGWVIIYPLSLQPTIDLSNVVAAASGAYHGIALRADRSIHTWGVHYGGLNENPYGLTNVVEVAAGRWHTLALGADGRPFGWGDCSEVTPPDDLTNVVALAAGRYHSLALLPDGRVRAWGRNEDGQCAVPAGVTNAVAIAGGGYHSLALLADGRTIGWGRNDKGQATPPAGMSNVLAIAAGCDHSLAVAEGPLHPLTVLSAHSVRYPTATVGIAKGLQPTFHMPTLTDFHTRYECTGWTGTGSAPAVGATNTVTFMMTQASTLAWDWTTNYLVAFFSLSNGIVVPDRYLDSTPIPPHPILSFATNSWYPLGGNVTLTGAPNAWHHFAEWQGDFPGEQSYENPLTLRVNGPLFAIAFFAPNLAPRGTPEYWIAAHGLTNQPVHLAEMDDRDGDGRPAWEEFTADTDPTNAASVLEVAGVSLLGDGLAIDIRGGTGAAYCVEVSTSIVAEAQDWTPLATNLPPTAPTNTFLVPSALPQPGIFRLRAWRP